ncbi:CTLH/CRA C-terminal to lish motif domain-containing protein [Vararia minispora EC-137]|uniref:CTLH/CRA C-terminal to lish motif domain-containing protein n=1 Tax=Vararia minispora EC-137 TaxID=1314806 RepID=A0ACB8QNU9_9AGAM|nr:CTLH/CRA C-terminal to lish motif domain-containing protein [Vararia minispora EC-137]
MPPAKRRRISDDEHDGDDDDAASSVSTSNDAAASEHSLSDAPADTGSGSPDTDAEIADAKRAKSKKTLKRKHRATDPSRFGAALQSLLATEAPTSLPLSLKPEVARKHNDEKLEGRARKVLKIERREKEDKSRIRDIVGGWGGESERKLRKVAQRGVVKLFNAIQQTQAAAAVAEEGAKASRGSGKPALLAPSLHKKSHGKQNGKDKNNILGRGKGSALDKDDFMDMIRSGGMPPVQNREKEKTPPPKVAIPLSEWEQRLEEVQTNKDELNQLVMDYLVIGGYKNAAEFFSQEANVSPPVDLKSIESRMNIREALQRGDVQDAITRVNDLNPEILDTNRALYFRLQQQKLIEFIRQGKVAEALEFAQDELAPRGEESPEFLSELERTMALLAFDTGGAVPSGIAELLSPGQRMKTAGEVNAAILESLSQGTEAKLVKVLRVLQWGEGLLSERADFPRVDLSDRLAKTAENGGEGSGAMEVGL